MKLECWVVEMTNRAWSKARPIDILQMAAFGRWNSNEPKQSADNEVLLRTLKEPRWSKVRFRSRRYRPNG